MMTITGKCLGFGLAALLAGCASAPPAQVEAKLPAQWAHDVQHYAEAEVEVAHGGSVTQLLQWWQQWHDPVLLDLIEAAQQHSPDLASAAARIAQARAAAVGTGAAMQPQLNAQAGVQRVPASTQSIPASMAKMVTPSTQLNIGNVGAQLQWEIDVFGGLRYADQAAQARLQGAQAQWHQARVSLAADTANQYFAWRACQDNLALVAADAQSRMETERLTGILSQAGFAAPAQWALTQAGTAQAQAQHNEMQAQCTAALKGLSALTALSQEDLEQRLQAPVGEQPALRVDSVPAHVLAQRPDVFAAAQAVAAAAGDVGQADAQRYPRISLSANVARAGIQVPRFDLNLYQTTWGVGPLGITLPLWDGGRRKAQVAASQAQYEAAVLQYQAALRNAVREVETALNNLHAARQRQGQIATAVAGFSRAYTAANAKYRAGMGSLLELEDARRNHVQAQQRQIQLEQQTRNAGVALYRALGGGWQMANNATQADQEMVKTGTAQRRAEQKDKQS